MRYGYDCHPLLAFEYAGGAFYSNQGAMHGERGFHDFALQHHRRPFGGLAVTSDTYRKHYVSVHKRLASNLVCASLRLVTRGGRPRLHDDFLRQGHIRSNALEIAQI